MSRSSIVCTLVAGLASAARAQEPALLQLLPEAKRMAVPDWVKAGMRATYYIGVGTHAGDYLYLTGERKHDVQDYTIEGRQGHFVLKKGGVEGSGHGYLEVNVAAAEPAAAALETRYLILMGVGTADPPKFSGVTGGVPASGACDWWIHPQALELLVARGDAKRGIHAGRVKYRQEDREIPAVYFAAEGSLYTWEAATGLLLYRSEGAASPGKERLQMPDGSILDGSGGTKCFYYLRGLRQVDLPWREAGMPKWLATTKSITYEGENSLKQPGFAPTTITVSATHEFAGGGTNWIRTKLTLGQGGGLGGAQQAPPAVERVFGPGTTSGLWIAPESLAALRAGQQIDAQDRWSHASIVVTHAGPRDGRDVVVITEQSPLFRIDCHYDKRSGGLVRWVLTEPQVGEMYTEVDLRLTGTR